MEVIRCGIKFTEWGLVDNEVVIELFVPGRREWWLCRIQDQLPNSSGRVEFCCGRCLRAVIIPLNSDKKFMHYLETISRCDSGYGYEVQYPHGRPSFVATARAGIPTRIMQIGA
jgi:hypothetical protein